MTKRGGQYVVSKQKEGWNIRKAESVDKLRGQHGRDYDTGKVASQHVVPNQKGGWSVRKSGSSMASRRFDDKKSAVDYAKKVAINQCSEVYIHKKDGTIDNKRSYRHDPCPPKEKK